MCVIICQKYLLYVGLSQHDGAINSLIVAHWPLHYIIQNFKQFFLPFLKFQWRNERHVPYEWTPEQLTISSLLLDVYKPQDIVNVCIKFVDVQLGGLYINFDTCDPDCPAASDASHLQHRVLQQYDHALTRAAVEYRVLRHIVYPLNDRLAGSGSFIARSSASGSTVDVILTGSSFHARDLCRHRLSTVVLVRTKFDVFRQGYLVPLESKALTSTKLYCNQ